METINGFDIDVVLERLTALVSAWGLKVIGALVVLVLGLWAAKLLRRLARRGLQRSKIDDTLVPFLGSLVYYLVLAVVVIAVLSLFGIQTTSLVAVLGAAGLAIGLALQGTLSNFSAGVMLLIFRPLKVGDYVVVAGTGGSVLEIGIFFTQLNTPDNVRIVVPNSKIFGETITNYATNDTRRLDLVVGISYGDDIGQAMDTIHQVLQDERILAEPAPQVAVAELGDSSVNLVVRPWCRKEDYWTLKFDLTRRLKESLEAAGCSIPFPQTDVHLHQA